MRRSATPSSIQKGREVWTMWVMGSATFRHLTQRTLEIPYRRFRTNYLSHLDGSWTAWPSKMGLIDCPEKSTPKSHKVWVGIQLRPYIKCDHRWGEFHEALNIRCFLKELLRHISPSNRPVIDSRYQTDSRIYYRQKGLWYCRYKLPDTHTRTHARS
jgi:hypothetical protein